MKSILKIIIITFFFFGNAFCQESKNNFNKIIFRIEGDLNNDKINDLVIVKEDTLNENHPCLLQIKFGNENGEFKSVLLSEKAIMEKSLDFGQRTVLEKLEIKKGILIFTNGLNRGSIVHKFRYQNGNFELIGYVYNEMSPGMIEYVDYNLSTGQKIYKKTDWDAKIIEKTESNVKIRPLPKLQNFTPFDFMY